MANTELRNHVKALLTRNGWSGAKILDWVQDVHPDRIYFVSREGDAKTMFFFLGEKGIENWVEDGWPA